MDVVGSSLLLSNAANKCAYSNSKAYSLSTSQQKKRILLHTAQNVTLVIVDGNMMKQSESAWPFER